MVIAEQKAYKCDVFVQYHWDGRFSSQILAISDIFSKKSISAVNFSFAIIGILSIAYSHTFSLLGIKAIRHKGKIKLLYLSAVWTFTTAVMPVLFNMGQTYSLFQLQFIFFTLHRFIFIAALSFIFNIYDISEDKENNISTFAVMAGQQKSLMTGKWLFTLLYICLSITLLLTLSSVYFFIILAILLPAPIIYFAYNNFNSRMPESTFALLYDGLMIVKALLLIFAVTVSKH
ncbi:MAG: UbiA family prenyltransferase [Chitinophagaceae bacterium]|nr:UbiA family prenyltransferase [Chitinophagaceae bacterium]